MKNMINSIEDAGMLRSFSWISLLSFSSVCWAAAIAVTAVLVTLLNPLPTAVDCLFSLL